ncbi:SRPBCC family protein [Blastococcus sp. TF02A-30]|uniref:SRPBCC family protein n=1 Tax=Blastococcus sp. TF02A-30 TaxID=2250580 RepID=UPI000DEBEB9A|nr:SRPBCC family protein [Blastococcus sp. TF02A-30]RBY92803.1 polyketide cyclase [Blastococcus sp. TF02A-30]
MTNTVPSEARITADPDVPLIRTTREFDAPKEKVFRAHADPDLAARWLGPNGTRTRIDRWECRTGGYFRYVSVNDGEEYGSGQEFAFFGSFHQVRPGELIVQTFTYEGVPDGVFLERLHLEDIGGGRSRLTSTSLCDSFADRDAMLSGMDVGVHEGYAKLDELLARG